MHWIAHYDDGSFLDQSRNGASPPATYTDIDRDRLIAFELIKDGTVLVALDFRDDTGGDPDIGPKRLIWRRRNTINGRGGQHILHLVGWHRTVKGRNIQALLYVNEQTGQIAMGGQPMEDPLMRSVKLQPQEV